MKKLFLALVVAFIYITFGMNTAFAAELPFVIEEGTVYYESAYNFGSGRRGTVNKENVYTTIPCYAGINGYAYLDKRGNVLDSDYIENEDDIFIPESPKGAVKLFKHFKSTFHRNGWVDADKIRKRCDKIPKVKKRKEEKQEEGEEAAQKPEKIVEDIEKDLQKKNQKTTIVIDFSGSMSAHQERVVDLLKTLEFNENTTIIVFGTNYEVISKKQLELEDFYVGGSTHMMKALNKATSLGTEKLIIISDLYTYEDVPLEKSETLKSVVIYDPDDGIEDNIVDDIKDIWDKVEISRIRIK